MSGTSLDGLDLCAVQFSKEEDNYQFEILAAETIAYPDALRNDLDQAFHLKKEDLKGLDEDYGSYIGLSIQSFIEKHELQGKIDLIGSHGHTIFHDPANGITVQIGDGQHLADHTQITVINDFRIKDVELGGQGAPLVPIGDQLLFGNYESCLNLGGIANISFEYEGNRIAFDVGPANMPLNQIMKEVFDLEYDKGGDKARSGKLHEDLLSEFNQLDFYKKDPPKSLGREWVEEEFFSIVNKYPNVQKEDLLRTIVEHEVEVIAQTFDRYNLPNCLVTGGGAYNTFFMDRLKAKCKTEIIIPKPQLIEFKEALIFSFLAYLNINNQINTLASVTGASKDSIGGIKFQPN